MVDVLNIKAYIIQVILISFHQFLKYSFGGYSSKLLSFSLTAVPPTIYISLPDPNTINISAKFVIKLLS
jgi:hypothetical protein